MDTIIKKIIDLLEPKFKEWLQEAYNCGYKIGEEDATRRAHELYLFGLHNGYVTGKANSGEIDIEDLSPEVFDEIGAN